MTESPAEGLLLVDKPVGPTSHDVVATFRRHFGLRRVVHAGTLDPTASGLLVLGFGRATRLLGHLSDAEKVYRATMRLGASTTTDDAAGELIFAGGAVGLTEPQVRDAIPAFTGPIKQRPSSVSAVHVDGRRAHDLVRAGVEVDLPQRPVTVHVFDVLATRAALLDDLEVLDVDIEVSVSTGTYVRALARDLGAVLGTGGHLIALRRTRIGPFDVAAAVPLDAEPAVTDLIGSAAAVAQLFTTVEVADADVDRVLHGIRLTTLSTDGERLGVFDPSGRLLALATVRAGLLAYDVVFPG